MVTHRNSKYLLHKVCENTGFHCPVFSRIRTKSQILSLCGRIRVSEGNFSDCNSAVIVISKLQNLHENVKMYVKKSKSRKISPQYCVISSQSKNIPMFNKLVIENANVKKKKTSFYYLMEGIHLPHN